MPAWSYIMVQNIPETSSWLSLLNMFQNFGDITRMYLDPHMAFVKVYFAQTESAEKAHASMITMGFPSDLFIPRNSSISELSFRSDVACSTMIGSNDEVQTVNKKYVDIFGNTISTSENKNGELYVSLKDLKKYGFELFEFGSLPSKSNSQILEEKKISQFELYMKIKAAKFMSIFNFQTSDSTVNSLIERLYTNVKLFVDDRYTLRRPVNSKSFMTVEEKVNGYLKSQQDTKVHLVHKVTDLMYWVQLSSNTNVLKKILEDTAQECKVASRPQLQINEVCAALHNNKWLRGIIFCCSPLKMRCIDYGYSITPTEFRKLSNELCEIPAQAICIQTTCIPDINITKGKKFYITPTKEVHLVHKVTDLMYWVQLSSNTNVLKKILEDTAQECKVASRPQLQINEVCAALHNNKWLRGIIFCCSPLKMRCIDYGYSITPTEFRKLSNELCEIPAQAICIQTTCIPDINITKGKKFYITPTKEVEKKSYLVNILTPSFEKSFNISLSTNGQCSSNISKEVYSINIRPRLAIQHICKNGKFHFVNMIDQTTFTAYVVLDCFSDEMLALKEMAKECVDETNFKPNVGDLVAARVSTGFVRAIIIKSVNKEYTCALIDYGTINTTPYIYVLPEKYRLIPEFAFECKLDVLTIKQLQTEDSSSLEIKTPNVVTVKLKPGIVYNINGYRWKPSLLNNKDTIVTYTEVLQPVSTETKSKNKSFERKTAIEKPCAKAMFEFIETISPSEFTAFVAPEMYEDQISILEHIKDDIIVNPHFVPRVGDLIAAETSDGCVRCIVMETLNKKYKCALVDYGTVQIVEIVHPLPDKYKNIPEFAVECKVSSSVLQKLKVNTCNFCKVKSPGVLTVTLDCGEEHEIEGCLWNPLKKDSKKSNKQIKVTNEIDDCKSQLMKTTENHIASAITNNVSSSKIHHESNITEEAKLNVRPKLVIERICDNGMFEFVEMKGKTTFTAFACPGCYSTEILALDEISKECRADPNFKPNIGELIAADVSKGFVRALVIDSLNGHYSCALIDYGTIETTTTICALPEKYKSIPEFSFECKLDIDAIKELQSEETSSLEIKTPNVVTVKLESGVSYNLNGYHWNPLQLDNKNTADTTIEVEQSTSVDTKKAESFKRNTVIEEQCDIVVFNFVDMISDTEFTAFVFPEIYKEQIEMLDSIIDDINDNPLFTPQVGELVAAETSEGCVRCIIMEILQDKKYKCALVDYGTVQVVDVVHSLPNKYKNIPEFAIECKASSNVVQTVKLGECNSCKVKSPGVLSITLNGGSAYEIKGGVWNPLKKGLHHHIEVKETNKINGELIKVAGTHTPRPKLVIERICDNGIFQFMEMKDETTFTAFACPDCYSAEILALEEISQECTADPSFKPNVGELIAAQVESKGFVRALVIDSLNSQYSCALIDYGTIETTTTVCALPEKYKSIPEFSFECKLDTDTIKELQNEVKEISSLEIKTPNVITVKLKSGIKYNINGYRWKPLQLNNKNTIVPTNEILRPLSTETKSKKESFEHKTVIEKPCAKALFDFVEIISETEFTAFVCPEIYEEEIAVLERIKDDININTLFTPQVGDLIVAKTTEGYVRCIIMEILSKRYKCALIDYGTVQVVEAVHPLLDKYKSIPEFAVECNAPSDVVKIIKASSCNSCTINSPGILSFTLDTGSKYEIKGYHWNPFKKYLNVPNEIECSIKAEDCLHTNSQRKSVIDTRCEIGVFEIVKRIDSNNFIATAFPNTLSNELQLLEDLQDLKYDSSLKPDLKELIALESQELFVRGVILHIENEQYTCALIDYGTIETTDKIYRLPEQYIAIPEFAFMCTADGASIDHLLNSKNLTMEIITPKNINIQLESGQKYEVSGSYWNPESTVSNAKLSVFQAKPFTNVLKDGEKVIVIGAQDTHLLVRNKYCDSIFVRVSEELMKYKGPSFLETPKAGSLAVCNFGDNNLYRVVIKDVKESIATIEYIDYGDVVSKPLKELKTINDALASLPNTVIKISLKGFVGIPIVGKIYNILQDISVCDDTFIAKRTSDSTFIEYELIGTDKVPLSDKIKLMLPAPAQRLDDIPKNELTLGKHTCLCICISELKTGKISMCLGDRETTELYTSISSTIAKYVENNSAEYEPKVTEVCLAKFEGNESIKLFFVGEWYRARILKLNADGSYKVFYLDYGNYGDLKLADLQKLPKELLKVKSLAILCCLQGVVKTNEKVVCEQLLHRLTADIIANTIYDVNVICYERNLCVITIPALLEKWKVDGLL
ncbi:hypothetical protein FQA39_LY03499 [Lamprigera yunnana]|nr:hypothetical protein FQA39_LY03499 [Lamprigera yunnana]